MSSTPLTDDDLLALLMADDSDDPGVICPMGRPFTCQASFAQQRLWVLQQLDPSSSAYHLARALHLVGPLQVAVLEAALQQVVARHEILRTGFEAVDGQPMQVVDNATRPLLQVERLAAADGAERRQLLAARLQALTLQPFDLGQAPLLRCVLFELGPQEHVLFLNMHHIVSDAWSNPILLRDLTLAYTQALQGDTTPLPALPVQYADYAHWQRHVYPGTAEYGRAQAYWKDYLAGDIAPLSLPVDRAPHAAQSGIAALHRVSVPAALMARLHTQCERLGLTPFAFVLGAWQLLLARYSGQADFCVGVPNAARNRAQIQDLVGYFVNAQLYRVQVDGATTGQAFLQGIRRHSLALLEHADWPIELLEQQGQAGATFETLFNWRVDGDRPAALRLGEVAVDFLATGPQQAKFALSLDVDYAPEAMSAVLEYDAGQFTGATIERLGRHWLHLLAGLAEAPERPLAELALLAPDEQHRVIAQWNPALTEYPAAPCLHVAIEAQAARVPQAIAVVAGEQRVTYDELNRRANRLAHLLRAAGVGPDVRVGVALERGVDMVVGLLAILKAGGAYVPMDPEYPAERLAYMLADSAIALLVTHSQSRGQLPEVEGVSCIELDQPALLNDYPDSNPANTTDPDNLAYVIYTSGSTGKPKGTLLAHRNVARLFQATQADFRFDEHDVWSVFHSYAFDFSVWELFGALLHGATAVIVAREVARSAADFHALLVRERVTVLNQTPSAFGQLIPVACAAANADQALALRYVVFGGEALDVASLKPWFERFGDRQPQLINMYGITETTVHVTYRPLSRADLALQGASPIGTVIEDLSWYLLDRDFNLVAPGCQGELHVGRAGLARGYHGRPGLTAERFVPDPFDDSPAGGGRLYRTGDLAGYRTDGIIDYRGRIDHQVKIRGFRIELGEIEARLQDHHGIAKAVVLDRDGPGGKQLVAYLLTGDQHAVSAAQQDTLRSQLRDYLRGLLPEHMVPAHLMFLQALPLTVNGKLDRKALPQPEASFGAGYVAPEGDHEQQIARLWAQVLKLERVGRHDNFFELGGHSLLATQVISRLRQALGLDLPLRALFEKPVLADFAALAGQGSDDGAPPIVAVDRSQPLSLSYAQHRQWFLWQLDPDSSAYNIPAALRLRGQLNVSALGRSFEALTLRHETLRTTFRVEDGQAVQVIHPHQAFCLQAEPVTAPAGDALQAWLQGLIEAETQRPFDLAQGPLLRVKLLRLADDDHVLVLTLHHIVTDGWSMPILVEELEQHYAGLCSGQPVALPALAVQYADYAAWQRQWMQAGEQQRQLAYWQQQLGGDQPVLELPTDRPRPAVQSLAGANHDIVLDDGLAVALKQLAKQHNATLFMVLLASFQALLHRYTGQRDIRVGVPIANRNRAQIERLIGFFVNTQVLRADCDPQLSFKALLGQVRDTALAAQAHQDLPFEQLVDALQPERSLSHSPLFQVMLNHQTQVRGETRELPGLSLQRLSWERHSAQFDLTLNTFEHADGLGASLSYATALFDRQTVQALADNWRVLLHGIVEQPEARIADLPLLDAYSRQQVIQAWNPAPVQHPVELCVHQAIEAQAARAPQAVAVTCEGRHLTYRQLNQRANRLARRLRHLGVGADVRVGLAMARSLDMVVGLLGILKAGGAYVPLDPEYPQDRLAYMIEDSGITLLLTQPELLAQLPLAPGVQSLVLEQDEPAPGDDQPDLGNQTSPQNLAYVIYTSGSTGRPKGTLLPHANVMRLFQATQDWFGFTAEDVWSVFHSYAFDFSVWEVFGALLHGARAVIVPRDVARSPEDFHALLVREQVTVLNQTPSAFKELVAIACQPNQDPAALALRYVVFGGEALNVASLRPWFERFGDQRPQLVNMYGITETTVHVSYRPLCLADVHREGLSPIGEVIPDLSWYLLDANLELAVAGSQGELHIGQAGLARGYHQRPALTAERFIPDPFDTSPQGGGRLYRTGDLARYRAEGSIDYVGRIDHQVKIRGFRIELGEIEARLQAHPRVAEAVVLDVDGAAGKQLVAYLIADQAQALDLAAQHALRGELRDYLLASLPDHMVPAHQVFLAAWPLTANGKLDRKALPAPDANQVRQTFVAPETPLQQQIAAIWADVLKLDQVGLADNFFELGGDSIISIQVVSRARQAGIRITPKQLFQHQTVQGLAAVATQGAAGDVQIDQGPVTGQAVLLPIHHYFFDEPIPARHHWNQALLLRPVEALDGQLLEQALLALIAHHDALRLSFAQADDGRWAGRYREVAQQPSCFWHEAVADVPALEAVCERAQRSLDLAQGPLLRAVFATLPDGDQRLLLAIHHLAVDGVSWRILLEDLQNAYGQLRAGQPVSLPAKTSSTRAWAESLRGYAQGSGREQLPYWQALLTDVQADLPCDNPSGSLQGVHQAVAHTRLGAEDTRALLQHAPAAYRTQVNDLLLTALARVIARWTEQEHVLVQLEGHGREDLFDNVDLTRTVGWFTSLFPVKLSPAPSLAQSLKRIKEQLRAIPDKGVGFGALRYLADQPAREALAALPVPRITFNYLGQFDGSFAEASGAGLLTPAVESSGASLSEAAPLGNWLSINGRVYGGELSLGWSFSREMFKPASVQRLADEYAAELKALIAHCVSGEAAGITPSDVPLSGLDQAQLDNLPVPAAYIEDIYPLSPMQQGMLFHASEDDQADLYINQTSVPVTGLEAERFVAAWQQVVAHHPILRTSFHQGASLAEPVQLVQRQAQLDIRLLDWSTRAVSEDDLAQQVLEDRRRGFDLAQAPLMRLTLIRLADRHHLIWTSHHLLMDGWSASRLIADVLASYAGHAPEPQACRYRDYIDWLQRQDLQAAQRFWEEKLDGEGAATLLASVLPQPETPLPGHAALYLKWDQARTQGLQDFAQRQRVTPNTLIQAVWLLLLQRYTGQARVCFGATVAGRPADVAGADKLLGLFINTIPVIQRPLATQPVAQWLQALQTYNLEARDFEHTSLADIQRWSGRSGLPLFDSIVVFENYPIDDRLQQGVGGPLSFGEVQSRDVTNYAMDLAVNLGNTLSIEFLYLRSRFSEPVVANIVASFETLLDAILANPEACLGNLPMCAAATPDVAPVTPQRTSVAELIAAQAQRRGDAIAVVCGGQQLSFDALERCANQLAQVLVARGIGPESRVGVALERSVQSIVAFYAVLKAGAAYVPLDIDYPRERLEWIIQDSGMALLLSHSALLPRLPVTPGSECLALDELDLAAQPARALQVPVQAHNLAYMIYTSGSTGQPKGVAVGHGPLSMHCQAIIARYGMDRDTRELLFMSFAFDGAQERWLSTLLAGGRLVMRDNQLWTAEQTLRTLREQAISIACFPPAYLQQLAEQAALETVAPPAVHTYCFGGDAVAQATFEQVKASLQPRYLTNGYGPTETVVTPLLWKVAGDQPCGGPIAPIGEAVGARELYVLDDQLNLLPDGVAGELYIGGEGLARGYHQRPGLTAERFVASPFQAGGRLYRSGDLVRRRADGIYDYLGRLDQQVKIRGFRIELGEIEARLRDCESVRDAVVSVQGEGSDKRLVGYVTSTAASPDIGEALREQLRAVLPDYMVPARILLLDALPLNPNGKVDRKALPDPDCSEPEALYVAPRNLFEEQLAQIWADVLGVERVGVTDNFFERGGDSLRSLKVISRVRSLQREGFELKLRDLMSRPTIAELSGYSEPAAGELDPLLLLNDPVSNVPPLFCLHAGYGTVFDYEPLARHLKGECSVYGVQCRMLLDPDWQDESLASMAIDYAQYIRQKQPDGPYRLLGWSLGGVLAVLVAAELRQQGQVVEHVSLVDSFIPLEPAQQASAEAFDWREELAGFCQVMNVAQPAGSLPSNFEATALPSLPQLTAYFASGIAGGTGFDAEDLAQGFIVGLRLRDLSLQALALPKLAGPVSFWWAHAVPGAAQAGFERHVAVQVARFALDSDHYGILRHPSLLAGLGGALARKVSA
ncbi:MULTISPECIES: non-ribosomal peptide synthetase [Pseudomonas]|uniref:non-ribosomal peptide synthetase n=1 Tax=Pseudomonas TaxID=286 RepID=UPI00069B03CD|nr:MULTISPECIES: non-ribosomal peptide synthetase [Pseudomonas]MBA6120549.1 non-ribosomal peptide synthetase [Pseudomonas juntendi]MBI6913782.1 non-ribosomal peptide synthetase [Pseudomonas juntendi]MCF3156400.1 non-ribosomal peptide synthetase [Pseudomonas juntendi]MCQ1988977.1 non-ribosomal peptide synthetase [Pseudomonas sp. Eb3]MDG9888087.1 non-ribosomal peptide synthetase [Pseudomonas juntendi]